MSELSGTILKKIRENRHIPLEQVAISTRIRLELLRDLEDEEFDSIASSAQKKGFIRLYTDYLQPTPEELAINSNHPEDSQVQIVEEVTAPKPGTTSPSSKGTSSDSSRPQVTDVRIAPGIAQKPVPAAKTPEPVKPNLGSLLLGKAKTAADQPVRVAEVPDPKIY